MSDKNTPSGREPESKKPTSAHNDLEPSASSAKNNYSALANRFIWADSTTSVERVIFWLGMLCAFLFVLDFIVHRHAYAPAEGLPGFYAVVGFIAFTIIVLAAAQLRKLILRSESYYSPNSVDAEPYPEEGLERLMHGVDRSAVPGSTNESGHSLKAEPNNQTKQENKDRGDSA